MPLNSHILLLNVFVAKLNKVRHPRVNFWCFTWSSVGVFLNLDSHLDVMESYFTFKLDMDCNASNRSLYEIKYLLVSVVNNYFANSFCGVFVEIRQIWGWGG